VAAGAGGAGAPITLSEGAGRLAGVATEPAVPGSLGRTVRTVGQVVADERLVRHIHTRVTGWVEKLYVNFVGQPVRAGEPLLALYSPELLASQEEYLRAREATLAFSRSPLAEVREGGEDLLRSARRRLELLHLPPATLDTLERTGLAQRTVTLASPVSGFVVMRQVFEGQQVDPGMDLLTVADLSRVWVEADFPEADVTALRQGQELALSLPSDPGMRRTGRVSFIAPTLEPQSRTLKVRLDVANRDGMWKPGMVVDVVAELGSRPGIVISESAVIDTGRRQTVFVESRPGVFAPRDVRLGGRGAGRALVLAGLAAGERVAVEANFLLDSESRLRAAVSSPPAAPEGHP
jgi:Cu(I)/Ag(I) efflux system membrane fusion protein